MGNTGALWCTVTYSPAFASEMYAKETEPPPLAGFARGTGAEMKTNTYTYPTDVFVLRCVYVVPAQKNALACQGSSFWKSVQRKIQSQSHVDKIDKNPL